MSPRTAVTAVFFLNGASFSSWYSRLALRAAARNVDTSGPDLAAVSTVGYVGCIVAAALASRIGGGAELG